MVVFMFGFGRRDCFFRMDCFEVHLPCIAGWGPEEILGLFLMWMLPRLGNEWQKARRDDHHLITVVT